MHNSVTEVSAILVILHSIYIFPFLQYLVANVQLPQNEHHLEELESSASTTFSQFYILSSRFILCLEVTLHWRLTLQTWLRKEMPHAVFLMCWIGDDTPVRNKSFDVLNNQFFRGTRPKVLCKDGVQMKTLV